TKTFAVGADVASAPLSDQASSSSKKETASAETPKAKAGAGQFSLFGTSTSLSDQGDEAQVVNHSTRTNAKNVSHLYQSVATGMATKLFIQNLMKQTSVCFDTETTSINPIVAEL